MLRPALKQSSVNPLKAQLFYDALGKVTISTSLYVLYD